MFFKRYGISTNVKHIGSPVLIDFENYLIPVIIGIYIAVTIILFIRYLKNIINILEKCRDNLKVIHSNNKIVLIAEDVIPHSFWNYIFLNKNDYLNDTIKNEIVYHE